MLSEEPSLKDRVIAFFKGSPKRYSFAPEMDGAAKRWIQEYKKIFDLVAKYNAGMNVVTNQVGVQSAEGRVQSAATQVPKSVIKRIGKIVPENEKTATGTENAQDSGERFAIQNIVGESGTDYGIGVYLDSTLLSGLTEDERIEMVKEYVKELGGKAFTAYDQNGNAVKVKIVESTSKYRNEKGKKVPVNRHLTNYNANPTKQEAIALVDELILTASQKPPEPAHHKHDWLDNQGKNDWDVWKTYIQDKENTVWEATLQIANSVNGEKILYEIHPIKMVEGATKNSTTPTTSTDKSQNLSVSNESISQKSQNSNSSGKNSSKDFDSGERSALADGKRATAGEVAAAKRNIREMGVDPAGIISIADKYFDRYSGRLTRTGVRYEFLSAAESLFDKAVGAMDRAYTKIEALAYELISNEKDTSGRAEEINSIKRHIREITFEVRERDKGEFDSVGGYAQFRKDNFGKLKLGNDGASVDTVYAELQNLYGTSMFPDLNTVGEMLIHIAEVLDAEHTFETMNEGDLEAARSEVAVSIIGELADALYEKDTPKIACPVFLSIL